MPLIMRWPDSSFSTALKVDLVALASREPRPASSARLCSQARSPSTELSEQTESKAAQLDYVYRKECHQ